MIGKLLGLAAKRKVLKTPSYMKSWQYPLKKQRKLRAEISKNFKGKMLIAYEPIWAIGSGKSAKKKDISIMNSVIRDSMITLAEAITTRKSVRSFTKKNVSKKVIKKIVA